MDPTSRAKHVAALAGVLVALGVLAARPAATVGGLVLAAWLLAGGINAVREFRRANDRLTVEVTADPAAVQVEEPFSLHADTELAAPVASTVRVTVDTPAGASPAGDEPTSLLLDPGETAADGTCLLSVPVAGTATVPPARVTLRDSQGLVTETIPVPVDASVRVDPRRPRSLHVGRGGDQVATYGEHPARTGVGGLVPEEIRQYTPGDTLDSIDWKATARLRSPHVREFELETDRTTVLVVDHRAGMDAGPAGGTMLDYAREVGLGYARAAESVDDPLGLYTVDGDGITTARRPTTAPDGYRSVRNRLHDLAVADGSAETARPSRRSASGVDRSTAAGLAGAESTLARTVEPFLAGETPGSRRLEGDPLFEAVRHVRAETTGDAWIVVLTSDADRDRLRDVSALLGGDRGHLSLFLTPRVLFEDDAIADLAAAYDRYAEFESFRGELDRRPGVDAYELGPGDRLDALLSARRRRQ